MTLSNLFIQGTSFYFKKEKEKEIKKRKGKGKAISLLRCFFGSPMRIL
jgi:hypothetical protein